jgi:hypothetical protein
MKESEILKATLDLLEALRRKGLPVKFTRTNAGRIQTNTGRWIQLCEEGWADITGAITGIPVMIECKSCRGKQREAQIRTQREWESAGGTYLLVKRLEILRDFLRDRGML